MKKRLTAILATLFLFVGGVLAQVQVKGTVVSADDGEPLPGVSVKVVGQKALGVVTDIDGKFSIQVPDNNSRLEVSHIGMAKRVVKARNGMQIVLESDNRMLDEVMVVAYGTEKKSAFTGSATIVGSDEIAKVQITNVTDALKGKAAGVQMSQASGAPGESASIRIRGLSSYAASNEPLIVVDGVPYDGDMNTINPADVETMTVLKDASSSALYGARGANGVILITTKRGKGGSGRVTVDAKWGSNSRAIPDYKYVKSPSKYYEMWYNALYNYAKSDNPAEDSNMSGIYEGMGLSEEAAWRWAADNVAAAGDGNYGLGYQIYNVPAGQEFIGRNGRVNPYATIGNVVGDYYFTPDDWVDETFHNSLRQEYNVSFDGNNDRGSFYASFNYLNFDGITYSSDYERLNGRIRADYKIKDWLKVGANVNYTHYKQNGTGDEGESSSSGNVFALTKIGPIYPLYNRDATGKIIYHAASGMNSYDYGDASVSGAYRPYMAQSNPLSSNQLDKNYTEGNTVNATGTIEVTLPYGFRITSTNNAYVDEYRGTSTTNPYFGQYASSNGIVNKSHGRTFTYDLQQILNWTHSYGEHNVSAQLGHDYYNRMVYSLSGSAKNMVNFENDELSGAVDQDGKPSSSRSRYNTESYFLRALYNYQEKYFAEGSVLRQGSSKFHPDHRWGTFGSAGAAWLISKENFMSNARWIDELKVKASYGWVGNDGIPDYLYTRRYSVSSSSGNAAINPSSIEANKEITWETGGSFLAGIDFSIFKGRLTGNVEYFHRLTSKMLHTFYFPTSFGFTTQYRNIGDMVNTGVEFTLNGEVIRTKDISWALNLNFSYDHNFVKYLPEENKTKEMEGHAGFTDGSHFVGEGLPLYTYYLHRYAGVDPETGLAQYWKNIEDDNGNIIGEEKVYDASIADYYLCGSARPEMFGGFGTSFRWKNLDLSAQFSYQIGGLYYDSDYAAAMSYSRGQAFHEDLLDAWTPTNKSSDIPRMQYNDGYTTSSSDRFLIDGSYLSLQNLQVGYTLPQKWTRAMRLESVRIYATGDNIWTWSKRRGMDPRQSITGGIDQSYAPSLRTISGGITVTF